jgi:NADH-quinone oxidoreductase subunit J
MISLFSGLALISGLLVIRSNNPVHSVLFLIFAFANVAAILINHSLDFFAFIFLVVYVGAIAVLFLFVVMMLNVNITQQNKTQYVPIGAFVGILFISQIMTIIKDKDESYLILPEGAPVGSDLIQYVQWNTLIQPVTNIEAIGQVLYTVYAPYFILASLILLVAMIGAIVLTMLKSNTVRRQVVFEQNNRLFNQTVKKLSAKV